MLFNMPWEERRLAMRSVAACNALPMPVSWEQLPLVQQADQPPMVGLAKLKLVCCTDLGASEVVPCGCLINRR